MDPIKAAFSAASTLAVVGVSAKRGFGNMAVRELRGRGYRVFAVGRTAMEVDGEPCYRALDELPAPVDGVVATVPPAEGINVVADCARLGLPRVWLQQGAESPEAERLAAEKGLPLVAKACILMYAKPKGFHKFHAWLWKRFGKL